MWGRRPVPGNSDQVSSAAAERGKSEASKPSAVSGRERDDLAARTFLEDLLATYDAAENNPIQEQDPQASVALTLKDVKVLSEAIQQHGAYLLVMREMVLALINFVPRDQRRQMESTLRLGVEAILIASESQNYPQFFQEVLIKEFNTYLKCLRQDIPPV